MKKAVTIILIICVVLCSYGTCFAVDIGPGAVPGEEANGTDMTSGKATVESTVSIEITVKDNGILFTVTDSETGAPIAGATITERLSTQESAVLIPGATDENGQLFREMPYYSQAFDYIYIVSAAGYERSEEFTVTYARGNILEVVGLKRIVIPTMFLVTDELGQPIKNARITITSASSVRSRTMRVGETCVTDENGYASCELFSGTYEYAVAHDTHDNCAGSMLIDAVVEDSHTEPITMQRSKFNVDFYVYGENGEPLADAVISMEGQGVRTNAEGYAQIIGLYEGTYSYTVRCQGYETITGTTDVPAINGRVISMVREGMPTGEAPVLEADVQESAAPTAALDETPVDISFWVKYTNGDVASKLVLELSGMGKGRTDQDGWGIFEDVAMGRHTLYIWDENGKILAQVDFDLWRDVLTNLELGNNAIGITVRHGVTGIIIELEIDPDERDGQVMAVREGYRVKTHDGNKTVIGQQQEQQQLLVMEEQRCQPFCLMTNLFGHPMGICMFLGLPCWVWVAMMLVVVIIVVSIIITARKKKAEEKNYDEAEL